MKLAFVASVICGFANGTRHFRVMKSADVQEPDTSCGKGFGNLVPGSQDYFKTAQTAIWTHPGRTGQSGTFEAELQCWFANMLTSKCGGLQSKFAKRNKALTEHCANVEVDWLKIWKMFDASEVDFFKKEFPAEAIDSEVEGEAASVEMHYKQAMKTALELNKKEMLCFTLFVIDDECGAHSHIRTA
eukprot:TRINITY_DN884_c0_g1_i3.p1 TRINITY_DN884_c0_g1~~TRINITY_DN884_c0_g1_i3.p1  ORF type:complete len:187 (-),score=35.46 TRINITY_DN884_c0_g1_i3:67-627(-)